MKIGRANGSGCVKKLSGKRRKPYVAVVTVGFSADGKQLQKSIGTFAKRDDALYALLEYIKSPFEIDESKATFAEVYDLWYKDKSKTTSPARMRVYEIAYERLQEVHKKRFREIKLSDLQTIFESTDRGLTNATRKHLKTLLNQVYRFALARDYVDKDLSQLISLDQYKDKTENHREKTIFTDAEIDQLWTLSNSSDVYSDVAKTTLILIYGGFRIMELLTLKKENVHLDIPFPFVEILSSKTEAGQRAVPIADKVKNLYQDFMDREGDVLISINDVSFSDGYSAFRSRFLKMMKKIGQNHIIHETRHTTITRLATINTPQPIINTIVGHAGESLSENVYTHIEIEPCKKWLDLI